MAVDTGDAASLAYQVRFQDDASERRERKGETLITAVAVFDGDQWESLCLEYDIASSGGTAEEAITHLAEAVQGVLEELPDGDRSVLTATPPEAVREFMLEHRSSEPNYIQPLRV